MLYTYNGMQYHVIQEPDTLNEYINATKQSYHAVGDHLLLGLDTMC